MILTSESVIQSTTTVFGFFWFQIIKGATFQEVCGVYRRTKLHRVVPGSRMEEGVNELSLCVDVSTSTAIAPRRSRSLTPES